MMNILTQYKTHRMIDYGTIAVGVLGTLIPCFLYNSFGTSEDMVSIAFCVFVNFYLVRSSLSILHYFFSMKFRRNIKSCSEELDEKLTQYPTFMAVRSIFRAVNICILLLIIFAPTTSFSDGLWNANITVIFLCILERLYLEKMERFDVSGEYYLKMKDAKFSGGSLPRSGDTRFGTGYRTLDSANPSSRYFDTSTSTRNNIY